MDQGSITFLSNHMYYLLWRMEKIQTRLIEKICLWQHFCTIWYYVCILQHYQSEMLSQWHSLSFVTFYYIGCWCLVEKKWKCLVSGAKRLRLYNRGSQLWPSVSIFLQSLAPTLVKHTWTSSSRPSGIMDLEGQSCEPLFYNRLLNTTHNQTSVNKQTWHKNVVLACVYKSSSSF